MATDATGTPSTNFLLPKYNVSADAPSGQGFNAFVDDLDTKLLARFVQSTDSKATDEVPVWNGTSWVFQKVTANQLDLPVQTYTPTWTTSGTAPVLNDGSITGRYLQIGKLVWLRIKLIAGASTTFGTGEWRFSLPPVTSAAFETHGAVFMFDSSATSSHSGISRWNNTTLRPFTNGSPAVTVDATNPFTWATSDFLALDITYEAA